MTLTRRALISGLTACGVSLGLLRLPKMEEETLEMKYRQPGASTLAAIYFDGSRWVDIDAYPEGLRYQIDMSKYDYDIRYMDIR